MTQIHSAKPRSKKGKIFNKLFFNNFLNTILFKFINYFFNFFSYLVFLNYQKKLYYKCEVVSGPFKGLKYSEPTSVCGPITPKLLGTYETELIPILNSLKGNKYNKIFNIGAAEGYYAIGLSMLFQNVKVKAYETDLEGFEYLKKNIAINNKSQTVECINKQCNKDIDNIKYNERMLIMCDCEGCEFEIFNKNNINNLKNSDLIIEMHVKSYDKTDLENHLSINHDIQRIGYGTSKMIDISNLDNYILDINNFSKVSRENRDKFHYFLIALAKNKNIIK